jgi:hypothetical protein
MAFGIILYDDERLIVAIDDAAATLFREPAHELVGRLITDFMPKPDRQKQTEARATLERSGEASGLYAIERADGSRESIVYRVLANAPLPGLNLMAVAPSDAEVGSDLARIRRIGDDVHAGLDVSDDDRWFGARSSRVQEVRRLALVHTPGSVMAAVFPTEGDAWAAVLAAQPSGGSPLQIALSSFDGGWPQDRRSVFAARGAVSHFDAISAIVAEFDGTIMAGAGMQPS